MVRSIAWVFGGTLVSRLLGFLRDAMIAALLGAGIAADAFLLAFQIITLIRRLLTEGALNAALVPAWLRVRHENGEAAAAAWAGRAVASVGLIVAAAALLIGWAAPFLVAWIAPSGFSAREGFADGVAALRLMLPYLALAGPAAVLLAIANAERRVAFAAAAPGLFNLVMIAVIVAILQTGWSQREAAMTLAAGVGIAGLAQLAMLFRAGAAARPLRIDFGSQTRAMLRAAVPGMVSGAGFQLLVVIGAAMASHEPAAVSWLYFASRLIDLPLGMIGALTGMVVMTESAHAVRGGDAAALQRSRAAGLGLSMALTLPAALGLWMLAEPIVRAVFVRGAFGPDDAAATARALQMLALALPAQALARTLAADLFAHGETRMPMIATLLGAAVTLLAAALLPGANASVVALAIALGSCASATMLVITAGMPLRNSRIGPICVSALAMAAMLSGALRLWPAGASQFDALRLALLIAGSVAAYVATLLGLGAIRCSELAALRRRGLRAGDARGNQPPLKGPQDFR